MPGHAGKDPGQAYGVMQACINKRGVISGVIAAREQDGVR